MATKILGGRPAAYGRKIRDPSNAATENLLHESDPLDPALSASNCWNACDFGGSAARARTDGICGSH